MYFVCISLSFLLSFTVPLYLCFPVSPNVSITWVLLQETFVALSWKHMEGDILGVRLGHQASEKKLEADVTSQLDNWDIFREDIGPQETQLEIHYLFDIHMYNSFILFPYEDEVMRKNNQYSGKPAILTVEPPPSSGRPSEKL